MSKLIRIFINDSDKDYITDRIENNSLFLFCKADIEDNLDIYCRKGGFYPVINFTGNVWAIEGNNHTICVSKNDPLFTLVAIEGGES